MQGLLTALGCGFKKWVGWKRLGVAASLLIIAFAITTLVRTLKGVDTAVILTALTDIPPNRIARAARPWQAARALSHRGDVELHQLFDRPQYRRHGLHRRRDPLPDLLRLRAERDRRRQDLLPVGPDVLARQPGRARDRHGLPSGGRLGDGPAAAGHEPFDRDRLPCGHRELFRLARDGQEPARAWPERLESGAAVGAADAGPGSDWRGRSRILR